MEQHTAFYFDGTSARPSSVRVLVFNDQVHLHNNEDDRLLYSFPLKGATHNQVGSTHYLYLDAQGLRYLQFGPGHPLAATIVEQVAAANPSFGLRLMKQRMAFLVPLLLVLVAGLYFLVINLIPFLGSRIIGVEQEIQMGDRLKEVMLSESHLLGDRVDTAGTRQLQAFADQLKLSNQYPIRLTLVRSKTVNAFALPGGQVVVYTGILKKIKTPEALAALLAHESTHVNERHSLRSLLRSAANGIIISILFSDASGISGALVSNAEALNGLHYSRSLETEADHKGMDLLLANGVKLDGMRQLMQALQELGDLPGALSFLSSHPLTSQRIREADRYIREHPQQPTPREDLQAIFDTLKQRQ